MGDLDDVPDEDSLIIVDEAGPSHEKEWQCIECGQVVKEVARPKSCPNCNCRNGDFGSMVNVFARREAVGWFD